MNTTITSNQYLFNVQTMRDFKDEKTRLFVELKNRLYSEVLCNIYQLIAEDK